MRGSLGAFAGMVVVPCGVTLAGLPGHAEFAREALEGAALADDALAQCKFMRASWRERARLVEAAFTVLENRPPGETGLDNAALYHIERGFGGEGAEEHEVRAMDGVLALVLGEVAEFFVGVVDVVQEVNPVLGGFVDEVHELAGDDCDRSDIGDRIARDQRLEGADVGFGGIVIGTAGQAAKEALGGFDRGGDRNVVDLGQELADVANGH